MNNARCLFCGAHFELRSECMPPPSSACNSCWLTIRAQLSQQREPDFEKDNVAKINFMPESWVIQ